MLNGVAHTIGLQHALTCQRPGSISCMFKKLLHNSSLCTCSASDRHDCHGCATAREHTLGAMLLSRLHAQATACWLPSSILLRPECHLASASVSVHALTLFFGFVRLTLSQLCDSYRLSCSLLVGQATESAVQGL